jgi:trehalose utilization protein
MGATETMRVTVWGENIHEHNNKTVRSIYPDGMHAAIADFIRQGVAGVEPSDSAWRTT